MATTADAFPIIRERRPEPSNDILLYPERHGDVAHLTEENMPPIRRHGADEDFDLRESLHILTLASTSLCKALEVQATHPKVENGNGTNKRVTWLMAVLAAITLASGGANFLTSSGIWVGNRNRDAEDMKTLKEEVGYLKTWNEKLRNNMAAHGWLIDQEGNVSRIESKRR